MKIVTNTGIVLLLSLTLWACANRGQGPRGGAKDEIPPRYVRSTPEQKARNIDQKKITIEFDEIINLKDIANNVIISPPQQKQPNIRSYMHRVVVELEDSLQDNTTYSIDFGQAITDNNEGNVLESFVMTFATGNELDTMQISGTVINASDLNPIKGLTVGIYSDLSDTAFHSKPFLRMAKTNDKGEFTIQSIKNGQYSIYALQDNNRDYHYQRGEGVAFDTLYHQTALEHYMRQDTLWKDSLHIDTVMSVKAIRYLPDNIVLRYFQDKSKRQYLVKSDRDYPHKLSLYFNTIAQAPPVIKGLNVDTNQLLAQYNQTNDTIHYWLADTTLVQQDTLTLQVSYLKTDTLFTLQPQTDTLHFVRKKSVKEQKKKTPTPFTIHHNLSNAYHPYLPILFSFDTPIRQIDTTKITLSHIVDTIPTPIAYTLQKNDRVGLSYSLHHKWQPEQQYLLHIDSAAILDIYGVGNAELKQKMTTRAYDSYATLKLRLASYNQEAVFQVVDKDDHVVQTVPLVAEETEVKYLEAGEYYVRVFIDSNQNGVWDGGDIEKRILPEQMYYYPKKLTLIKNWEFQETINLYALPIDQQKPEELKKTLNGKGEPI